MIRVHKEFALESRKATNETRTNETNLEILSEKIDIENRQLHNPDIFLFEIVCEQLKKNIDNTFYSF